jgi:ankyrin repeat protein
MVRDANGYTALLKAASLGRKYMVQRLIESGVDPRHTDPYGNTARDKALLYNRYELSKYIQKMEIMAENGELTKVDWSDPVRFRSTGKYRTVFDY